jgi:hypothetical protein
VGFDGPSADPVDSVDYQGLLMVLGLVLTRPDGVRAFGKAFDTGDH